MNNFEGKLVLVTGGAKGIGKIIAREFAVQGAHILLNFFHSLEAAKQTKAELEQMGAQVDLLRASVAKKIQLERMFQEIKDTYGYLDVLVNNAADGALFPTNDIAEEHLDRAFNSMLKGSLWCSQLAAPLMEKRGGGAIVNMSSIGSPMVIANYLACGPIKASVEALTRYLAVEFAPLNIRVNTASGGLIDSPVIEHFPRTQELQQVVKDATPLGRLGQPEDLARVVSFLASDQSRWVTGQVILADGGLSLGSVLLAPPSQTVREIPVQAQKTQPAEVTADQAITATTSSHKTVPLSLSDQPETRENFKAATERTSIAAQEYVNVNSAPGSHSEQPDTDDDDIVVVGMGVTVAGANNPEEFWRVMVDGPELFSKAANNRWDNSLFYSADPAAEDKTYQDAFAFITNLSSRSALEQDTQQSNDELTTLWLRHALQQALENVKTQENDTYSFVIGYTADGNQHLDEASVIAGATYRLGEQLKQLPGSSAEKQSLFEEIKATLEQRYRHGMTEVTRFLPHNVGYNAMHGILPADTELQIVDTACSSSLYAMDIGIKGLLMGKQDIAVCGGAFALTPRNSILFAKLHGLSVGGQGRSLDKNSDGVLFADGAGVVVLKKKKKALEDGDHIFAVLKALGSSSDGKGKAIYAPNSAGQALAIERAINQPQTHVENIDWIVAHATGTTAGDLAEFTTLRETIIPDHPIYVTSNKSLIGHTGWAAGVISLIEVILGLEKELIPPQYKFTAPPDSFQIETTQLRIPTTAVPWPAQADRVRAATVSSFGFGGTNAHLVVEEYREEAHASRKA
ncbi:SDR family oxidoreductase [Dictyobacter arantiisoli]|uniref:Ketosynthase family 3 (KS3) domain-containing protein n=1 Tax=Dictyobacter arantiisoli TaxID=2014874 RepID=A0A5A5TFC8_9CHLR|nr:SDR family oxidoreductase [Dictyobacter arantiisoli]GCF09614.1 hypothetical protein KDI_31780 [Dictyobacter arantiisoli]